MNEPFIAMVGFPCRNMYDCATWVKQKEDRGNRGIRAFF